MTVTSIEPVSDAGTIRDYSLEQNYPNPFNPSTNIRFAIPTPEFVTLKVFNIAGQEVSTLVSEQMNAGTYNLTFEALDLASGLYFYQIQAGEFNATKRIILMK